MLTCNHGLLAPFSFELACKCGQIRPVCMSQRAQVPLLQVCCTDLQSCCRCTANKSEDDPDCKRHARAYRAICPGEWVCPALAAALHCAQARHTGALSRTVRAAERAATGPGKAQWQSTAMLMLSVTLLMPVLSSS